MRLKVNPQELTNQKIAEILRLIAAAYTIKNGPYFKIVAYNNAADEVEHLNSSLFNLWQEHKNVKVTNIGSGIRQHLNELFEKGESKHFNELLADIHPAVAVLIKVPGIGPKIANKLATHFSFPTEDEEKILQRVIELADKHKLMTMPNFKEKSESRLKKLVKEYLLSLKHHRFLLSQALKVAEPLIAYILTSKNVDDAVVLGSLRRRLATVGDIDIAVKTKESKKLFNYLRSYPNFENYEVLGRDKARLVLKDGYRVDIITSPPAKYGSLIQYLTGSKFHNIALREYALKKNLSLSEHGIKDLKKRKLYTFSSEKEFYNFLGLRWIEPELRENRGEIEAANEGKLPKIIKLADVKGDLHLHSSFNIKTNYDLGKNSILELAEKARTKGYQYLAISDHLPRPNLSLGEKIELIRERNRLIEKAEKKTGLRIFKSLEVDITTNGELAIEEEVIKYLDFIIVSVHTNFHLDIVKMSERILKGFSHPKAKFLAHPTGRLLNKRPGYKVDWQKLFSFVKDNGKALEINSTPERLDLSDEIVFNALKYGVKLVINTDAHSVEGMDWLIFGVWTARRGWATKEDVYNCLPLKKIEDWLLAN